PPHDPWLAGYGISYYYFGYVLLNLMVWLTGVAPGIAFNLGLAGIFALTLLGAFGLGYNLVRADVQRQAGRGVAMLFGGLAALFVGIMGNLEGVLESLQSKGLLTPGLRAFFDIKNLDQAPVTGSWMPQQFWWWWRASRTLHDYNFAGTVDQEVIDEFPFFSFLLGDMHPHVLNLPFVLLAIGLALNLLLRPNRRAEEGSEARGQEDGRDWRAAWAEIRGAFGMDGWGFLLYGIAIGALGFTNFWDFPIYVFLLTLMVALRIGLAGRGLDREGWLQIGLTFVGLTALGFLTYLPFYLSFSSQAKGFLPNLYNPTRFVQYFLMFGPFLVAAVILLAVAYARNGAPRQAVVRWLLATWLLPALFLLVVLIGGSLLPGLRSLVEQTLGQPVAAVIPRVLRLRLSTPGTWLAVGALLATLGALGSRVWMGLEQPPERTLLFVVALFFTALLLTYGVEFIFLRDTFGTRMNTVFKFYYQAWILMSIGSSYALYYVTTRGGPRLGVVAPVVVGLLVLGGLVYPAFAIPAKADNFRRDPTLDGTAFVAAGRPDEAAVIRWLRENTPADAVIVEANGGSYSDYNTISAHSGRATLLGWGGHELQWRGNYDEPGRREPLIETIYRNQDEKRIREIVEEFGIDYLILGPREIEKFKLSPQQQRSLQRLWEPVFETGSYTVYRWRG
ncbi:MAG: hypothetical protein D6791_13190, partial [Chloroflexi bacterium]